MYLFKDLDSAAQAAVKLVSGAELGQLTEIEKKLHGIDKHL